ncbi:terpene cyclase/mutase family protein [Aliiroseovarius sp. M344]|uniref:prenyltransferase/squalene oxidase repeat-containing protein n=1 Tax=Aliiroseovarius sp. M344 TaxID=2867010 RepID=UPI0021ADA9E4|nr:prenyltransferase/squalene oxidase repeat-containing protein [Aliiroseovarius sp. M344]UWQ13765.1 terpene cyclase/mutase family protein [Aliiroseovarius sp. M344]
MNRGEIISWLMAGDSAIAFQTMRDLLHRTRPELQARIATNGWGKAFLDARNATGGWGDRYYGPKWACTHYVLLDLVNMAFPQDHPEVAALVHDIAVRHVSHDGGFAISSDDKLSDTCVTGMFLNIGSYFAAPEASLQSFVDFLISVQLPDGGFNCQINRSGCKHSSLHSTLSVLEGLHSFEACGYAYRKDELNQIATEARSFILRHQFFRSERTGKIINADFLKLRTPARWYYNTLRALDHFRATGQPFDPAMTDALDKLVTQRRPDGRWPRGPKVAGKTVFEMEPPREPGRWNTLIALRVLDAYPLT